MPLLASLISCASSRCGSKSQDWASQPMIRMRQSGERMSLLIENILDFSRGRLGRGLGVDRRPTDIAGLVEQVVAEVQIVNPERGIQTHCDIKANVRCDPVRIAQLLSNPVDNAIFSR